MIKKPYTDDIPVSDEEIYKEEYMPIPIKTNFAELDQIIGEYRPEDLEPDDSYFDVTVTH